MPRSDRSLFQAAELVLASLVVLVVVLLLTNSPWYPTWPTVGEFPVDPELVVPGVLGVVALGRAIVDGLSVSSVVVGVLSVLTVTLATLSLHTLYTDASAGAFAGGLFTLTAGASLAFVVITRNAVREITRRELIGTARSRLGNS